MALRLPPTLFRRLSAVQSATETTQFFSKSCSFRRLAKFSVRSLASDANTNSSREANLVRKVKEKLEKDHFSLPTGKNGRDDEELILWFLKDRRFSVEEAVSKLTKAIKWRQEFGVSELSEESVRRAAATGKAFVHDSLDVRGRPVLVVVPSKHFIEMFDRSEDERLCVFLLEKALSRLPEGKEEILGIFDLREFGMKNADLKFLTFLFDVLYYYYPRRLGEALFVDAPFVFQPIWQLVKPLIKQYASLVRFCSVEDVRKEYFTESTVPASLRH